jgi:hypothetical protein
MVMKEETMMNRKFIKVITWIALIGMIGGIIATIVAPIMGLY